VELENSRWGVRCLSGEKKILKAKIPLWGTIADWLDWRGSETYLRALDEGFKPTTIYFGISIPKTNPETEVVEESIYTILDDDGAECLVLFSRPVHARQYCREW
jgi:hypothetical protein